MRIRFLADAGSVNTRSWVNAFAQDLGHEVHVVSVNRTGQFAPQVVLHHLGTETGTQDTLGKLGYPRNVVMSFFEESQWYSREGGSVQ